MLNQSPTIKKTGKKIQPRKIINPAKIIKTSTTKPMQIKKILITAPILLENKLEITTSKYLLILNPLP